MPQEVILLKLGEIALKGLNRKSFEDVLLKNIRRRLQSAGAFLEGLSAAVCGLQAGIKAGYPTGIFFDAVFQRLCPLFQRFQAIL